jgi:hypothetical protein
MKPASNGADVPDPPKPYPVAVIGPNRDILPIVSQTLAIALWHLEIPICCERLCFS